MTLKPVLLTRTYYARQHLQAVRLAVPTHTVSIIDSTHGTLTSRALFIDPHTYARLITDHPTATTEPINITPLRRHLGRHLRTVTATDLGHQPRHYTVLYEGQPIATITGPRWALTATGTHPDTLTTGPDLSTHTPTT